MKQFTNSFDVMATYQYAGDCEFLSTTYNSICTVSSMDNVHILSKDSRGNYKEYVHRHPIVTMEVGSIYGCVNLAPLTFIGKVNILRQEHHASLIEAITAMVDKLSAYRINITAFFAQTIIMDMLTLSEQDGLVSGKKMGAPMSYDEIAEDPIKALTWYLKTICLDNISSRILGTCKTRLAEVMLSTLTPKDASVAIVLYTKSAIPKDISVTWQTGEPPRLTVGDMTLMNWYQSVASVRRTYTTNELIMKLAQYTPVRFYDGEHTYETVVPVEERPTTLTITNMSTGVNVSNVDLTKWGNLRMIIGNIQEVPIL